MMQVERRDQNRIKGALRVGVFLIGVAALAWQYVANAQSEGTAPVKKTASPTKSETRAIEKKLDQILANQETILQKFDAIQSELQVVKIRCTR